MRFFNMLSTSTTALLPSIALADQRSDGPWDYGHMMWGGGYGIIGGLMMLVFWGLVIFLIVVAVRRFTNGNSAPKQPDALDVLRDRFAKGEIDEEEFQKRKSTLES